jgi:hypothetical protein
MRTTFILVLSVLVFASCNKDKYTTAPQIKFKSVSPDYAESSLTTLNKDFAPKLTIEVTDAEGDLGFVQGQDTSKIYIKNVLSNNIDSFLLPDLKTSANKNFKADIIVNLFDALDCIDFTPTRPRPRTDTIYYDIYVTDFAKNKSNIIRTEKPVYYRCL